MERGVEMKKYNIVIYNESDVKVYDEVVSGKTENEAIINLLSKIELLSGDTLKIEII